jgi:tRNA(Ile)-lysidine synthase
VLEKKIFEKLEQILFAKKMKIPKKIAVAVSGGADSLALTIIIANFCLQKNIKLFAVTIDHKMRQNSKIEAKKLNKILTEKNIFHQIIPIKWKEKPNSNIEAKMREARYKILSDFCEKNEIGFLFLGHHIGDLAENFLIRLFRGSGLDGLSSMSEIYQNNSLKMVRPMLNISKEELKKFLKTQKIEWFEDETNDDERILRNKIRKFLQSFDEYDLIEQRIKKASDEISYARDLFDKILLKKAKEITNFIDQKFFLLDLKKFVTIEKKIALKILALILMEVGEKSYKPRFEKLERFYYWIIENQNHPRKNFYGCMVKNYDLKNLVIYNEKNSEKKISLKTILNKIYKK